MGEVLSKPLSATFKVAAVLVVVLFLLSVPVFPAGSVQVSSRQAESICTLLVVTCPLNPEFSGSNPGYVSTTYLVFHFGFDPYPYYPVNVTVYVNKVPRSVFLWNSNTACTEHRLGFPTTCVTCEENFCTKLIGLP